MKSMKAADLRGQTTQAMKDKLRDLYQEAFNLRFQHATAQMENTAAIRRVRRDIARINTLMGERARSGQEG